MWNMTHENTSVHWIWGAATYKHIYLDERWCIRQHSSNAGEQQPTFDHYSFSELIHVDWRFVRKYHRWEAILNRDIERIDLWSALDRNCFQSPGRHSAEPGQRSIRHTVKVCKSKNDVPTSNGQWKLLIQLELGYFLSSSLCFSRMLRLLAHIFVRRTCEI